MLSMRPRASSYGTLPTVFEEPELPQVRCCCTSLGADAPALLLLWIFFAISIYPIALVHGIVLGILAVAFTTGASTALLCLSWKRSVAWRIFCSLCLLASVTGFLLGSLIRSSDSRPVHGAYSVPSGLAVANVAAALFLALAALTFFYQLLQLVTRRAVVGSSAGFEEENGWGWHPTVVAHMHFGVSFGGVSDVQLGHEEVGGGHSPLQRQVTHRLLRRQCYWSGEPAFDYFFHLANTNMFLSCLLCHPVHPMGKRERVFILATVCTLIVFPVAAFSVMLGGPLRAVLQLVLVTVPRNVLKRYLLKIAIEEDTIIDRSLNGKARWQEVVRNKVFRQSCDKQASSHWRRRVDDTLRTARAHMWEFVFCTVCLLVTTSVCAACSWYIVANGEPLHWALLASCDGLAFANILELILDLVAPSSSIDGAWQFGFFGQWWRERP